MECRRGASSKKERRARRLAADELLRTHVYRAELNAYQCCWCTASHVEERDARVHLTRVHPAVVESFLRDGTIGDERESVLPGGRRMWRREESARAAGGDMDGIVVLFYCYTGVEDVELECEWFWEECIRLNLKGKVRIASEGYNVTLSGTCDNVEALEQHFSSRCGGAVVDFKRSEGKVDSFGGLLRVRECSEIVPLGLPADHNPDVTMPNGGMHLSPEQFHSMLLEASEATTQNSCGPPLSGASSAESVVLLDCRNTYEWRIGRFRAPNVPTVLPTTRRFSDFPAWAEEHAEELGGKKVLMYCTGGIRCERASAFLRKRVGVENVYQLSGGIHRYVEQFGAGGDGTSSEGRVSYWDGKNYVFDERQVQPLKGSSTVLSRCELCAQEYDVYMKCHNRPQCQELVLWCGKCAHPPPGGKSEANCEYDKEMFLGESTRESAPIEEDARASSSGPSAAIDGVFGPSPRGSVVGWSVPSRIVSKVDNEIVVFCCSVCYSFWQKSRAGEAAQFGECECTAARDSLLERLVVDTG